MLSQKAATQSNSDRTLIVAIDSSFMPFEFEQDGVAVGFDVDLWSSIAKVLKLDYKFQPIDFNGIIPGLQTGNIDVALAGITINDQRMAVIDFSAPYYASGLSILVRDDNNSIKGPNDLKDRTVAVRTGTFTVDYMQKSLRSARLRLFPDIDSTYLDVATGRADAAVHDTPNMQYYANTVGKGQVRVVANIDIADSYGIAFPKGSPLVAEVNNALATLKSNGTFDSIFTKWFGRQPQ